MSISIITRPTKLGSNWNALGNPVIFKVRRQDHFMDDSGPTVIDDSGGFARITLDASLGDSTGYYQAGNSIYFMTDNGDYDTVSTVTSSSFGGGTTKIITTTSYTTTGGTGGIVNNLSKRTDYKLVYNFKSVVDDSELIESDLEVSPFTDGIMRADASILKNLLTPDWSLPGSINVTDSTGSIGFYLSYQEYYDGALQGSVTDDDSNPIYGLLGANQIGEANGSNMLSYYPADSTRLWLTKFYLSSAINGLKMWRDWPFTVSFIGGTTSDYIIDQTDITTTGSVIRSVSNLTVLTNAINRLKVTPLQSDSDSTSILIIREPDEPGEYTGGSVTINDNSFVIGVSSGAWGNSESGQSWAGGGGDISVTLTDGNQSKIVSHLISEDLLGQYIKIDLQLSAASGRNAILIVYAGPLAALQSVGSANFATTGSTQTITVYGPCKGFNYTTSFGFRILQVNGGSATYIATEIAVTKAEDTDALSALPISIEDVCDYDENNIPIPWKNPILLQWKNSAGGDAFWMFHLYHEVSQVVREKKAKRIILFADDLDPVQWEAINELNSVNDVYRPAIIDLENTNTINSTSKQIGKQVYMVAKDGTKTGVIVIPSSDRLTARDVGHRISIEIELPEFFEA